jgi:hypothetical protein
MTRKKKQGRNKMKQIHKKQKYFVFTLQSLACKVGKTYELHTQRNKIAYGERKKNMEYKNKNDIVINS